MSSSTSNSNLAKDATMSAMTQDKDMNETNSAVRKTYAKAILALGLSMFIAMTAVKLYLDSPGVRQEGV